MKSISFFYFLALLLLVQACKSNTSEQQDEIKSDTIVAPAASRDTTQSGGHDYTFLTNQLFHYKASHTVGKDPKDNPYEGQWIDLESDGTYKAGTLKKETHTGTWNYNNDQKRLQLIPNDAAFNRSEWNVMHNVDMMVWVGTQTYGNNATQIQLERSNVLP